VRQAQRALTRKQFVPQLTVFSSMLNPFVTCACFWHLENSRVEEWGQITVGNIHKKLACPNFVANVILFEQIDRCQLSA
jgi:hypothetical protein